MGGTIEPIVIIDPGHGGIDPGGGTNKFFKEKDLVLKISLYQYARFKELGVPVAITRTGDETLSATPRTTRVKKSGAKYCISNHINAGGGDGAEFIHSIFADGKMAHAMAEEIKREGQNLRRIFTRQNSRGLDWYYMHRETGKVQTVIAEYGFADSPKDDVEQLRDEWKVYAESIVRGFCRYIDHRYEAPKESTPITKTPIFGEPEISAYQLEKYVENVNPDAPKLAEKFIEIGKKYGVRGDLAYCQSVKETGFFEFGGDVKPDQHNYAGIGATGGVPGNSFETEEDGITAQIQHLYGYASTEPIPKGDELLDPRFKILEENGLRGTAEHWEELAGKWAWPGYDTKTYDSLQDALESGETYGQSIILIAEEVAKIPDKQPEGVFKDIPVGHWAEEDIKQAKELGVVNGHTDGTFGIGEEPTKEQAVVMLMRLYDVLTKKEEE